LNGPKRQSLTVSRFKKIRTKKNGQFSKFKKNLT
jgi:hypothetical protein